MEAFDRRVLKFDSGLWPLRVLKFDGAFAPKVLRFDGPAGPRVVVSPLRGDEYVCCGGPA
jgi:hypothetical protein